MHNKTFAFSNKFDKWATRYSFTPSWYGSVDNHFLSAPSTTSTYGPWFDSHASQLGDSNHDVFRHDVNPWHTYFYEIGHSAGVTVASNQDPSAVKIFNSLSIESNRDKWFAVITTNEETDAQEGKIFGGGWKEKEGFVYADMPKSTTHSTSSISYAGLDPRSFDDITAAWTVVNDSGEGFQLSSGSYSDLIGTTEGFTIDIKIDRSEVPLATGDGCELIFDVTSAFDVPVVPILDLEGMLHMSGNSIEPAPGGQGIIGTLNELELVGVYGDVLRIRHKNLTGITWDDEEENLSLALAIYWIYYLCRNPIYVISPTNINGDSLRGPYVKMQIVPHGDFRAPFELSSINVDYQFSKLDARLTQNT